MAVNYYGRECALLIIDDKVEVTGIKEAIRDMGKIDKDAVKALRKEMRTAIMPTAKAIAAKVPTEAPLSGFNHSGRTRWTGARARVSFAPARIRRDSKQVPVVSIVLTGKGQGVGFDIAEVAGSRDFQFGRPISREFTRRGQSKSIRTRQNGQGRAMVREMQTRGRAPWRFKAGRFGYGYFLAEKKSLQKIAGRILDNAAKEFSKKIARRG